MLVIGLTGPSGAGKSEVGHLFASYGLPVINADEVYHTLLMPPSPCLSELTEAFGKEILNPDGTLNRPRLSSIVFSDRASLERLNAISHRHVMEEVRHRLQALREDGTPAVILDAPQLFEAGADKECDTVVSVLAKKEIRLSRIMERDGLDRTRAEMRLDAQKSDGYFLERSSYVIENNETVDRLRPTVEKILCEMGVIKP